MTQARRWSLRLTGGRQFVRPLVELPVMRRAPQLKLVADRKLSNRRKQGTAVRGEAVRAGRFCFLNQELCLPDPVDWRLDGYSKIDALWRFHLHYHEFLLDLMVEAIDNSLAMSLDRAWQLVRQWVLANPLTEPRTHFDAWHPFCISRRLPVWIVLWQFSQPPTDERRTILESMFRQATFLASHLERDLGGNHLLENAHALALAGSFFEGTEPDRWLRTARDIILRELPEQILEHGEHFERSPMYHAQMLDAILDLRDAVQALDPDLSQTCNDSARRMARFLEQILHPDGEIPLLSDSVLNESPPARELIRQAEVTTDNTNGPAPIATLARRVGDYWIWRDKDALFLLDGGPVGPDHLPAHAHSDLSTFEFSIGGQRMVVDSGVFAYSDDELRRYCRSTEAHNVLQIDDQEQCDTWSRFRMGYRGRPVSFESGCAGDFDWARIRHNAFRRIGIPSTGRWVACRRGGPWLVVDWAEGHGSRAIVNRLHLHPDVRILNVLSTSVRIRLGSRELRLGVLNGGNLEIVEGFYCPEFGRRITAPVVRWTTRTKLPSVCGWWWDEGDCSRTATLSGQPFEQAVLRWKEPSAEIVWQSAELFGSRP